VYDILANAGGTHLPCVGTSSPKNAWPWQIPPTFTALCNVCIALLLTDDMATCRIWKANLLVEFLH